MPNKDWTGPNWEGPRTWKGRWDCESTESKEEETKSN